MKTENKLEVRPVQDGIWDFVEVTPFGHEIDAYLICGETRAIMFDTLQEVCGLYEKARELTDLPIDVVISHGHGDHYGAATEEFIKAGCPVYLNHGDWDLLANFIGRDPFPEGHFQDLEEGHKFDLGGRTLTAMLIPGHTPASDILLDQEDGLLFTGDAIGSGSFWMQLPTCVSVEELLPGVEKLLVEVRSWDRDVLILPGHRYQSPVPLGLSYIEDVDFIVRGLLDGTIKGESISLDLHGQKVECEQISYGLMRSMLYDPNHIHA